VAKRISRIIRRARTSARDRGLPVEKLLPAAEILAGVLAGLLVGGIAWSVYKSFWATHRVSTMLAVAVDGGVRTDDDRQQRAASAVASYINNDAGFAGESEEAAGELGLKGKGLRADVVDSGEDEGGRTVYVVNLTCEGRPGEAAAEALIEARDRIVNQEPIKLKPRDFEKLKRQYQEQIDADKKEERKLQAGRAGLKPSPAETKERRAAQNKLDRAEEKYREALDRKRRNAPLARQLTEEIAALEKEMSGYSVVAVADAQTRTALEDERRDLTDRLSDVDAADCTGEHPIIKRLKDIGRRLRASELPGLIATRKRKLEAIRAPETDLARASEVRRKCQDDLEKVNRKYGENQGQRDQIHGQLNSLIARLNDNKAKLAALERQPHLNISITADAEVLPEVEPYGWAFYLAGMLLGVALITIAHRLVMPAFSVIDDELDLADRLRTPVLGKVPRLAMLSKY